MPNHHVHTPPAELTALIDVLYRFGTGVDGHDDTLLATAFSEDAVVDFGPCGRAMALEFPVLTGGAAVVRFLAATGETQTTSHVISNGRAEVDGATATLRALVDATHRPKDDPARHCRMMNWYDAELVKQAALWRMRRLVISNVWFSGDVQVLLGR